jgi:hypothetical protein
LSCSHPNDYGHGRVSRLRPPPRSRPRLRRTITPTITFDDHAHNTHARRTIARKVTASISYRVPTRRPRLMRLKNCSTRKRDLNRSRSYGRSTDRPRRGGITAREPCASICSNDRVGIIALIGKSGRTRRLFEHLGCLLHVVDLTLGYLDLRRVPETVHDHRGSRDHDSDPVGRRVPLLKLSSDSDLTSRSRSTAPARFGTGTRTGTGTGSD